MDILNLVDQAEKKVETKFKELDKICELNSLKVLNAFHKNEISEIHFNSTTGYGYGDIGREAIENVYKDIFKSEDALVRNQLVSGSHALTVTLFALLRPNDLLLSITGKPYDTLDEVIGIKENESSLASYNIKYDEIDLKNNKFDIEKIQKYLKENKIKNIKIDVFGTGDYVDIFEDIIYDNDLDDYIEYMGLTTNPSEELIKHDFAVDFSLNQSFGMSYIEGILNGLTTFAYENYGSKEVLKEFPELFIKSNEDLVNKINNIPNVSKKELCNRYDVIMNKYSREAVADRFIKFIGE